MMADDFAFYGNRIPSLFMFLGVRNPRLPAVPLYSPNFNPDERSIAIGIKILSHVVLDYLDQQSRLKDAAEVIK
jgi:amidohydrolase